MIMPVVLQDEIYRFILVASVDMEYKIPTARVFTFEPKYSQAMSFKECLCAVSSRPKFTHIYLVHYSDLDVFTRYGRVGLTASLEDHAPQGAQDDRLTPHK
jgi:hypothetical protein